MSSTHTQRTRTLYEILEVHPQASQNEIAKAYRKGALKTHPDRGGDEAAFKEIALAYETLSDTNLRQSYDRGELDPSNIASSSSSHAPHRRFRDPFDDPFFQKTSFSTSFGRNTQPHMDGDDPYSLFDRMFGEFNHPFGPHPSRGYNPWDPFGTGFGTFGVNKNRSQRSTFLDSFFGSGPDSFRGMSGDADDDEELPPGPIPLSTFLGVEEKRNQRSGKQNCSFSTSFGAPASISESISTSTRIVDGKREDVYKKVDARGNSTIHIKDADGKQRVFVNGVQQAQHPLLGDKETEEKPRSLPAAGDGSRGRPYEIF